MKRVGCWGASKCLIQVRYLGISVLLMMVFSGCLSINLTPKMGPLKEKTVSGTGGDKVLLVEIKGVISNKKTVSSLGVETQLGMVDRVREILKKAEQDDDVKALMLRIDSPGGTVTASDIIYHEIKLFKQRKNIKVYAVVMDLAASGGYYIAQAADRIFVHPTSLTGSIGVIALKMNIKGLMDKIGVDFEVVKSGEHKDFLSPFRPMTEGERKVFQETIDSMHQRFVSTIEENRKQLSRDEINELADGRIYTSEQALKAKLVDQIAYLDEAEDFIQKDLGLDALRVVMYYRSGQYKSNIYSSTLPPSINFNWINLNFVPDTPELNFMYLWMP